MDFNEPTFNSNSNNNHNNINHDTNRVPPPRPELPRQLDLARQKSASEQVVNSRPQLLTTKQQDKLKGWLHTVRKKTARLSTKITASLGLIALTRDEEFEKHYEAFKQLEKTIRIFVKNLTTFVDHFESFLLALQSTSENLANFYLDKTHQKELIELRRRNKSLACEHFHIFKRTIDKQVISVASQLVQKFSGPRQLINKRSTKLLDYDTKLKQLESCRDLEKRASLRDEYVIAKDLYDRVNNQLIEELPLFNQYCLDIFRECLLVLLESRRSLIQSYTQQTASLLDTPLMASYTASDVASTILMSADCNQLNIQQQQQKQKSGSIKSSSTNADQELRNMLGVANHKLMSEQQHDNSNHTSDYGETHPSSSGSGSGGFIEQHDIQNLQNHLRQVNGDTNTGPAGTASQSVSSQLSSEFEQMAMAAREISSTPLSHVESEPSHTPLKLVDQYDRDDHDHQQRDQQPNDEPDGFDLKTPANEGTSDNELNEIVQRKAMSSNGDHEEEGKADIAQEKQQPMSEEPETTTKREPTKKKGNKRSKAPIYVASWPFAATGPNQLTISSNQHLKLIKGCDECGNSDWSLVKDKKGQLGYVPSSYIKLKEHQ